MWGLIVAMMMMLDWCAFACGSAQRAAEARHEGPAACCAFGARMLAAETCIMRGAPDFSRTVQGHL